ncbi:MAG: NADH-quinone oxidoreductase subunit K [Gammaproteobacteria bacterium]|nr:NADH-quinone oxidoreductase subunit K [Gammaproteobacteria bacterium]
MIWAVALALGIVIAAGTYLALSRDVLRCLIGLALMGSGVNLLLFAAGRLVTHVPPIILDGETLLGAAANPLPQALVLTAIVIGFALLCFSLVLAVRLMLTTGTHDTSQLRTAEPAPTDDHKPALEDVR